MSNLKSRLFRTCPKSGKIVGVRQPEGWARLWFPVVGLAALAWFLLRVVPKPSRAAYPCQRVAMPLASGFVLWLAGMAGASLAFGGARRQFRQARWLSGGLAVLIALAGVGWALATLPQGAQAGQAPEHIEYTPHPANEPIGVAKGLAPGRVVWVHDPQVTDWAGAGSGQRWYQRVNQAVSSDMLATALQSYAESSSSAAAWDAIFRDHNGGTPYQSGQKIFIKINLTTSYAGGGTANIVSATNYDWKPSSPLNFDSTATTPQLMLALLDQLVNEAGIAQSDITIGDPTGLFVNEWYTPLHNVFPNVHYLDNYGALGRTRAEFGTVPLYWSTSEANDKAQDYLPSAIGEATYLIDLAVLKSHEGGGVTNTAKNHYGSLLRTPTGSLRGVQGTWYNIHNRLPGPGYRTDENMTLMGQYRPLVDLNGHAGFGGKTVLFMIDGAFGGYNWNSAPSTWPLFNGDWPSSLFVSMDQVAIDSVAFDFVSQQWSSQALMNEGVQDYLHEMALANNPPSGTFYDPERDNVRMESQGVHEHWNNPTDKQYSRNLGTGDGIELVRVEKSLACGLQSILFVGSSNPLNAADQAMAARLSTVGYRVETVSQSAARTIDANGKDLVIISDSVDSPNVNTKFRDVTVPVINWEPALYDDLKMTGVTNNTDYGSQGGQTQVNIVNPAHPLAAGLSAGLATTTSSAQNYTWGAEGSQAVVAARLSGSTTRAVVFGYEKGATMVGMNAPARRVGFFNGSGAALTANGWALYDSAVTWALECGSIGGGFSVINADTGEVVQTLNSGDTLELTTLPSALAFQAGTDPAVTGSVAFTFDGQTTVDNTPPYQFDGAPLEWTPGVGAHTLTAQPFSQADGAGAGGEPLTVQFDVTNSPLAVTVADFSAAAAGDHVALTWSTVSEIDNTGFNLYRATSAGAARELLAFVASAAPGSAQGADYSYTDRAVLAGQTYFYWLEALDLAGATSLHGPVEVTVLAPTAVTLSSLAADGQPAGGYPTQLWLAALAALILLAGARAMTRQRMK